MQHVVPKITEELLVMQWNDIFDDFLNQKICVRTISLSYMTRATALASWPASYHTVDLPHVEEFDSIKEELVAQASHTHPLYHEDNEAVYYYLEEAVPSTQYASSLKPYQADNWQAELSMRDKFLHEEMWNGQMLYPLERFNGQHRGSFIAMKEAAEHVPFQLPSETSKRHHFELAATYLQPCCPVLKKFTSGTKYGAINISDVSGSCFGIKPSAGKTCLSLR
eukprot:9857111-Ditylum_brightwellii.AAC.1